MRAPDQINVRPCTARDLPLLERDLPPAAVHAQHLRQQDEGVRTYLGAFLDRRAVGTCVVSWDGCREPALRQTFPDAIEIAAVQVGEAWRGRGVGTALIQGAEWLVADAGRRRVVIGVADDNPRAEALYLRLGFESTGRYETSRYELPGRAGDTIEVTECNHILIKDLGEGAPRRG